jgi:cell fate regulator YaaT (PSP1 superfamily)
MGKTVKTKEHTGKVIRFNFLQNKVALRLEDRQEIEINVDEIIK